MGKKAVPLATRYEIIAYKKLGYKHAKIAELCNVSNTCVNTTVKNHTENGSVDELSRSGRPRSSSEREDNRLFSLARSDHTKSVRCLTGDWQRQGETIASKATVNRRLLEFNLNSYVSVSKPLLTKALKKCRLEWCQARKNWGYEKWASIIFSDEANYQLINRKTNPTIRRFSHEKYLDKFVRKTIQGGGGSVGVWGCMTSDDSGCCQTYAGRLNAIGYVDILENNLKPSIELLTGGNQDFLYQQDGAPCHTANLTKDWFGRNSIEVIPWPARSPDLNPIEHIWVLLDRKLTESIPKTLAELEVALVKLWNEVPSSLFTNLVESMPRRLDMCIKAKGGYFKY